jgi:hypothetical protein
MAKKPIERVRPRIGDILEFPLLNGKLAYIQFVNNYREKPVWGPLIRVLPGIYSKRPDDILALARKKEVFVTFVPITHCMKEFRIVENGPVPDHLNNKWPLFKAYNENYETKNRIWWLWDGKKEWRVGKLSPEHIDLPMRELIDLQVLEDRIVSGWRPRNEVRPQDREL